MAEPGMPMSGAPGQPVMGVDPSGLAQHLKMAGDGGLYVPGLRPLTAQATFVPAASYLNTQCFGGMLQFAFTLPGGGQLPSGTNVLLDSIVATFGATGISANSPNAFVLIFNSAPTTVFQDAAIPAINGADAAKMAKPFAMTGVSLQTYGLWAGVATLGGTEATVDATGKLCGAIILASAPPTYTNPQQAAVTLGIRY